MPFQYVRAHDGRAVEIVCGNIKKALNLPSVQINGQHSVGPSFGNEIGHELGRNGRAWARLPVLARITEIGQYGGDAFGRRPAQRVYHDQQFHQIVICGMAGGLNHKHIFTADIFVDFYENFIVGEAADAGVGQRQFHIIGNSLRQRQVAVACHQFHMCVPENICAALARRGWPDNRLAPLVCGQ